MKPQHKKPCRECPWRRNSLPGYLGASNPLEFLQTSEAETRMPCHLTVDYDDPEWERKQNHAPQCAGRAIHFKNRCKNPRNRGLLTEVEADREGVFTFPQEFIDHHTLEGKIPVVQIAMGTVLVVDEKDKP